MNSKLLFRLGRALCDCLSSELARAESEFDADTIDFNDPSQDAAPAAPTTVQNAHDGRYDTFTSASEAKRYCPQTGGPIDRAAYDKMRAGYPFPLPEFDAL